MAFSVGVKLLEKRDCVLHVDVDVCFAVVPVQVAGDDDAGCLLVP